MKKLGIIFLLALLAGAFAYGVARFRFVSRQDPGIESGANIAWLKDEFNLSDAEFSELRQLHESYAAVCAGHCADIAEAQQRIETLVTSGASETELSAARQELLRLESICNEATRAHIYRVASKMPLEAGVRFIRATEPHVSKMPHDGDRGLPR